MKTLAIWLCLVMLLLAACGAESVGLPAREPSPGEELPFGWITYTTADGLANNFVWSVAAAPDGAVWFSFGRDGRVSRFDPLAQGDDLTAGQAWTTYTMRDGPGPESVWAMAATPDGVLWLPTPMSLSRIDPFPEGDGWRTYSGRRYEFATAITAAPDGALWLADSERGVVRIDADDEAQTVYTEDDGLPYTDFFSIAVTPDGDVWLGTQDDGVAHCVPPAVRDSLAGADPCTRYTTADGLLSNHVYAIAVSPNGPVWVATSGGGVNRFDPDAASWRIYTPDDGLAHDAVQAIAAGPDGAMWFGTIGGGVSRFDPLSEGEAWTTYTTADGLASNTVLDISLAPDGALWFGTMSGVSRYEPVE